MTIKSVLCSNLQYFINGSFKQDQYDSRFDVDYRDVNKRYSCAKEMIKENPELFDGILTTILNIFIYVSREAKWAKKFIE